MRKQNEATPFPISILSAALKAQFYPPIHSYFHTETAQQCLYKLHKSRPNEQFLCTKSKKCAQNSPFNVNTN